MNPPAPDPALDARSIRTLGHAARVFFSRPGPRWMAAFAVAGWAGRALFGPPRPSDLVICAAAVGYWPFQEWWVHQEVLHAKPGAFGEGSGREKIAERHRAHHRDPGDVPLAFLPNALVRQSMITNAVLWSVVLPKRSAFTAVAALSTMTLFYEWTHFIVHTGYAPKSGFGRHVRRHHLRHHFHNEHYWMSFTVPWVDTLLGTNPEARDVPRSPTARNLHGLVEEDSI